MDKNNLKTQKCGCKAYKIVMNSTWLIYITKNEKVQNFYLLNDEDLVKF